MPVLADIVPGMELPARDYRVDSVQLFLYNAALWNAHRIHFDQPYATTVEGYPGLVVAGPLMGDWLTQCVLEWLDGTGRLASIEYRNLRAAYAGDALRAGGCVRTVEPASGRIGLDLHVHDGGGGVIVSGRAVVLVPAA